MRQINVMQRGEKRRHEKYPSVRFVGVCLDGVARLVKVHASSGLVRAVPQTWRNKLCHLRSLGFPITCQKSHNNWVTRSCSSALNNSLGVHFTADLVIAFTGSSVCIPPKAGRTAFCCREQKQLSWSSRVAEAKHSVPGSAEHLLDCCDSSLYLS